MAGFRVSKPYTMPKEEVRVAAEGLASELERDHGVRSRWEGDTVRIKGAGVDGLMSFSDGVVDVNVKLGLVASMFEPVLRKEVQRYLDSYVS
ncbi:MAG: polyhydroxyalkanoic acid system family protein [Pseudomonadota bacterium]